MRPSWLALGDMRKIPEHIYSKVLEIGLSITNASERSDEQQESAALKELQLLAAELEESGNQDPFVLETLADFTSDNEEAIRLYRRSIELVSTHSGEPCYSKQTALAERLFVVGEEAEANQLLQTALSKAIESKDAEAEKEIRQLL